MAVIFFTAEPWRELTPEENQAMIEARIDRNRRWEQFKREEERREKEWRFGKVVRVYRDSSWFGENWRSDVKFGNGSMGYITRNAVIGECIDRKREFVYMRRR